ncbi:MAG TPA: DoxX family protein [Gammaproteobacteria bacterium]|nr:DoxX family protein [Gammaproteobacteria bacterium]
MKNSSLLLGRILMAAIFIWSGIGKITGYAGTEQYIESLGVAGGLLPLIILWELGGGVALLLGLFTRPIAIALALFCVISGFLVHLHPGDQMQMINFMKNLAMAGGFLFVAAQGAGDWSVDRRFRLIWA